MPQNLDQREAQSGSDRSATDVDYYEVARQKERIALGRVLEVTLEPRPTDGPEAFAVRQIARTCFQTCSHGQDQVSRCPNFAPLVTAYSRVLEDRLATRRT